MFVPGLSPRVYSPGERIGKPDLQYIQFSDEDEVTALVQAGLSESFAKQYVEMTRAFNEQRIEAPKRNEKNTTPTRFEDFANELAQAYQANVKSSGQSN